MDPEGETAPTSGSTPPEETTHDSNTLPLDHGAQPPPDRLHTIEVDEVVSHPSQLTEDVQREAKRPRVREVLTMIRLPTPVVLRREPYWMKPEWINFLKSEKGLKKAERARIVGQAMKEKLQRLRLNARIERGENVLSEEAKEVIHPSDAGRFQNVIFDFKPPPGEESATLNLENVSHLSEPPLQQEQAKLPEGLPSSNNRPREYCMSDEFIERLDKKAEVYFSEKKELGQEEIIANGLQFMNEEAFLAFRNYIAENDLVEGFDYGFGEVLHHCFSVEEYRKVYCHYNFTIKMKKNDEDSWTSKLYFAEAKLMHGVKYYFCSPLLPTDDGQCYSCTNQRVIELKHPSGGGYEKGHKASGSHYPSAASSDDDECA